MRSVFDRIRHAVSFELLGLLLITPVGAWLFDLPMREMGIVGVASATIATAWNYVFNLGFDHALQRLAGTTRKSVRVRVLHAVVFELGLLVILMPLLAWYLRISLWQAFWMDVYIAAFYMAYAFAFNWAYDQLFPLPQWQRVDRA